MAGSDGWRRQNEFWASMPLSSQALFLFGVFLLFSTSGVLFDMAGLGGSTLTRLFLTSCLTGAIAVAYVLAVRLGWRWLLLVVAVHLTVAAGFDAVFGTSGAPLTGEALKSRMTLDVNLTTTAILVSFALLSQMIRVEGTRYGRLHAEVSLAHDIHQRLVPAIDLTAGGYAFRGVSLPSGEVGGDLIDVVSDSRGWTALLADVSGHGVGAGVLMGMIKAAARAQLHRGVSLDDLQTTLGSVLYELKNPAMFATFAALQQSGGELRFTVAGHLPILRHRQGAAAVEELTVAQLPLAMFADTHFTSCAVATAPGDLFVLLTDGLTEVFDRRDQEFGLERVKALIAEHRGASLAQIEERLLAAVRAHGPQIDDRTLLLVRRL